MSIVRELRRRNVFRMAVLYAVAAWLIMQVAEVLIDLAKLPDWVGTTTLWLLAIGLPIALIFSWFYEITPEGLSLEKDVDPDISITHVTGRRLDFLVISLLAAAVILFAYDKWWTPRPLEQSVVVLPFENLSADPEQEYFSNGLTETLLNMLAQIPDLKVAARTSSFVFKDQDKTIEEIAGALAVAYVLEGSVQRAGNRVRITAKLIRAADGFHVWSENYDRTIDDIFGIQDEIAEKVGSALSVSLFGTPAGNAIAAISTSSTDAFDLYLQALNERVTRSFDGLSTAEGLLKRALTIDPDFLEAKTELASLYLFQADTGLMEASAAYAAIMAIVDQVLIANPNDVATRAIMAYTEALIAESEGDPSAVVEAFEQIQALIEEAPSLLQPRILLARLSRNDHQREQSLKALLEALENDPLNPLIYYYLGDNYAFLEQWENARLAYAKSLELEPNQPNACLSMALTSLQLGDGLESLQLFLEALVIDPVDYEIPAMIAGFLYGLELVDEGDKFKNQVMAVAPTSPIAYRIVLLRAISIGDEKAGVAAARRTIEDDVDNRRFAFGGAVQYLMRVAAARGTVEEESAYLEEHAPGILDVNAESVPLKYKIARAKALDAWYVSLPRDELMRRLDTVVEFAIESGFDEERQPNAYVNILALRGEIEKATEIALNEIFSKPVASHLGWEQRFRQAQYAEIIENPRVQAAMKKWQEDEDALREQIRRYMADRDVATE